MKSFIEKPSSQNYRTTTFILKQTNYIIIILLKNHKKNKNFLPLTPYLPKVLVISKK